MSEAKILFFDELPSTNQKLKELIVTQPLAEFSVVMARSQFAGRGQMGNRWESEAGKNLTFSVHLQPSFMLAQEQFLLSKVASVAIAETLVELGVKNVKVKWPNDIYVGNRKIAGLLIENSIMGQHIEQCTVGIGLNVNQMLFTSDAPNPVSLSLILNQETDLHVVFNKVMDNLCRHYVSLVDNRSVMHELYRTFMFWADGFSHPFNDVNGDFEAIVDGTDDYGRLLLTLSDGSQRYYEFKEVAFLI